MSEQNWKKEVFGEINGEEFRWRKGFKGTNINGNGTNNFHFEVGQSYSHQSVDELELCANTGFHFCRNLENVFGHFSADGYNRFFEIEYDNYYVLHENEDRLHSKSITKQIKIVREITDEVYKAEYDKRIGIDKLKDIAMRYPQVIIGGSLSLYLRGIIYKRYDSSKMNSLMSPDFDIIVPFWTKFDSSELTNIKENIDEEQTSGSDFDESYTIDSTRKMDVRIDPKHRYDNWQDESGFIWKLSPVKEVLLAKMRYAVAGKKSSTKHYNDLLELMNIPTEPTKIQTAADIF